MALISPLGPQFFKNDGTVAESCKLYTYVTGTTTPATTYSDQAGTTPHTNPVVLDTAGRVPSSKHIWLTSGAEYRFRLETSAGGLIWELDDIYGCGEVEYATLAASGGSALVGFLQSGSGAVARTAQSKMRDVVSVKDFGAVGDGSTDDKSAIQAALDSGAKFVFFPQGTYMVTGPLLPRTQQTLFGAKRESTIIKAKTGFAGSAVISYPSGAYSGVTIENLLVNGDSLAARCLELIGSSQGAVDQIILRDVRCALATTTQIYLENITYWDLDHVISSGGTGYALYLKTCYTGTSRNGIHYHGATAAVKLENCSDNTFMGLVCFNNSGTTSTSLLEVDGGHGNVFRDYTLEPQGASNVTQELLINDTVTGNGTGHEFISGNHIGLANTKTRSIVIGATGSSVYQTLFENLRVIKPTGNDSVLHTSQQETWYKNCRDLVAYDTPSFSPITVTADANPYNADHLQNFTLTITGSTGNPTDIAAVGTFSAPGIKNHTEFRLKHNFGAITWTAPGTGTFQINLPFSVNGMAKVQGTLFATAIVGEINGTVLTLYAVGSATALTWAAIGASGSSLIIDITGQTSA